MAHSGNEKDSHSPPLMNGTAHLCNGTSSPSPTKNSITSNLKMANSELTSDDKHYTPIPQFYAGKDIFITGGTGFMGKVLVEKLLRSCPDIKNIYLLIRPKRGQDVKTRLKDLLNAPLFDKIRQTNAKQLDKVLPILGDITKEELGISAADQALLKANVSIVFHSAATIKFDEKLKLAVTINMLGTKRLMNLCLCMQKLDAVIHVSTAYCNCDRTDVSEVIYTPPFSPNDIISLIRILPEEMLEMLTPKIIGNRPNTYTFTKALTEQMLLHEAEYLPIAIVRPSIVTASANEPFAGWIDNFNGPTGLISSLSKGLIHSMICEEDVVADLVPVDIVINLMIAAAWRTGTTKSDKLLIYNCCTGQRHPIKWKDFVAKALKNVRKHPAEGCIWYPTGVLRKNHTINTVHSFIAQFVPAYIFDAIAVLSGKKPFIVRTQNKIVKTAKCLEYFSTRQWNFSDDNVHSLLHTLSAKDRETFVFDVRTIDWEKFVENYVLGFRLYLFKQQPETLATNRKRMLRLYYIHQISKLVMVIFTWRFLMARSKRLRDIWSAFLANFLKLVNLVPFAS